MSGIKTIIAFISFTAFMASQTPRPAEVRGRVIDAVSRLAVRGALVSIGRAANQRVNDPGARPTTSFLTGGDGAFRLRDLRPGDVEIVASKHGFIPGGYGKRRPGGTIGHLLLREGGVYDNVELVVWPMATISGTVFDDTGEPLPGAIVTARRLGNPAAPAQTPVARSDDRGQYMIGGLVPGEYLVGVGIRTGQVAGPAQTLLASSQSLLLLGTDHRAITILENAVRLELTASSAVVPQGSRFAYTGSYFGRVTDAALATTVTLAAGDERNSVDLFMRREPAFRVAGRITWQGAPAEGASVTLTSDTMSIGAPGAIDGSFALPSVPAGTYTLIAQRRIDRSAATIVTSGSQFAQMPLVVRDRDQQELEIPLRMGATVSGTVEAPNHIALEAVRVRLERPSGEPSAPAISAFLERGPFALAGIVPGEYVVRIDYAQPGIALESVEVAGRNVTDVPIQIDLTDFAGLTVRLTDRPAAISGAVRRPDGKDSTIASVVLFPTDSSLWSAKTIREPYQFLRTRVEDGKYSFDRVARGEYYLAAVDDALLEEWRDRSLFMALIGRAVRVTVQPGETVQRDFTLDER